MRAGIGRWYSEAVDAAGIAAIGDPEKLEIGDMPADGEPLTFTLPVPGPVSTVGESVTVTDAAAPDTPSETEPSLTVAFAGPIPT